ncbi:MAG: hypothetical protein ABJA79_01000 [Parafilimonas sp.]
MKSLLFLPFCMIAFVCGSRQSAQTENAAQNNSITNEQSAEITSSQQQGNDTSIEFAAHSSTVSNNQQSSNNANTTASSNRKAASDAGSSSSVETLKPQTAGLALRDFSWLDKSTNIDLLKIVNSFIVKIYWKDVQSQENGELKHPNAVDDALAYVRKMNAQNPGLNLNLKIRLYCGVYTPDWVKAKAGTFTMYKGGMNNGGQSTSTQVVKFWKPEFLKFYTDIQSKLAAAYDNTPEITEAVNGGTGILYAEGMIRNVGANGAGKKNAMSFAQSDYTSQKDIDAIKNTIDAMKAWKNTRVSMVFTPFFVIKAQRADEDLSITKNILDYFVNKFGNQAVLGNNGLRDKYSGDKSAKWEEGGTLDQVYDMLENYTKSKNIGVYFQTATVERIGDLKKAIEQGIQRGAGMIELPTGSNGLLKYTTLEELKKYDAQLEAQAKK